MLISRRTERRPGTRERSRGERLCERRLCDHLGRAVRGKVKGTVDLTTFREVGVGGRWLMGRWWLRVKHVLGDAKRHWWSLMEWEYAHHSQTKDLGNCLSHIQRDCDAVKGVTEGRVIF